MERDAKSRAVERVVVLILVLNAVVAAVKGVYGWSSGSLAVASDALHSLLDAGSNVLGLVVLRFASSPPDEGHPYGHHKIEIVAAAAIGVLISGVAVSFAWSAVGALAHGRAAPSVTGGGLAIMAGTLVVNVAVATYEYRRGRALGSAFLVADAAHTASDVVVTIAVIASLVMSRLGVPRIDPIAALVVMLVIARVAWRILRSNASVLVDHARVPADEVRRAALSVAGVVGCHRVRSRGTDGAVQVDLHLLVDGELPLRAAHGLSHAVEAALRARFPEVVDVTIHIEPDDEEEETL